MHANAVSKQAGRQESSGSGGFTTYTPLLKRGKEEDAITSTPSPPSTTKVTEVREYNSEEKQKKRMISFLVIRESDVAEAGDPSGGTHTHPP